MVGPRISAAMGANFSGSSAFNDVVVLEVMHVVEGCLMTKADVPEMAAAVRAREIFMVAIGRCRD